MQLLPRASLGVGALHVPRTAVRWILRRRPESDLPGLREGLREFPRDHRVDGTDMRNNTRNDFPEFTNTGARIWLRDTFCARKVYAVSDVARKWDGTTARFALHLPQTDAMAYIEVKVTGRKWRYNASRDWRLTCRVRFVGSDVSESSGEWHIADLFAGGDTASRIEALEAIDAATDSLREISAL